MFEELGEGKDKRNSQHTKPFALGPSGIDVEEKGKEIKDKVAKGENRETIGQLGDWRRVDGFVEDNVERGLSLGHRSWARVRSYPPALRCQAQVGVVIAGLHHDDGLLDQWECSGCQ